MNILLIGDIVGKPGRRSCSRRCADCEQQESIDLVVANAENAAGGSGLTPEIYRELIAAGVDCITLGDHIYRRREIDSGPGTRSEHRQAGQLPRLAHRAAIGPSCARPTASTWSSSACWAGSSCGRSIAPGRAADRVLAELPEHVPVRILDFHAEATSDKQLMGRYLDGRVSAVLGTHTHVPTADEQILPGEPPFSATWA